MNKKAVSPLAATFVLLVCAIVLGAIVMNIGRNYVEGISDVNEPSIDELNDPLQILKIRYSKGDITQKEYDTMKQVIS